MKIIKSDYLASLQCAKLMWHRLNAPELLAAPDPGSRAIVAQGEEITKLACGLFPDGIYVGGTWDAKCDARRTTPLLAQRKPLFEATFEFQSALARVDVINPVGRDAWDLIEVKSTTSIKDEHLEDVAFQAYVLRAASLPLRRCYLAYLRRDYIRNGALDPQRLFVLEDVTEQTNASARNIDAKLAGLFQLAHQPVTPKVPVGLHCQSPHPCPLSEVCWQGIPEGNVFTLYRGGKRAAALYESGITRVADIPPDARLTEKQVIQRAAAATDQPQINHPAVKQFLRQLRHPLAFLDFETYSTACPLFDGLRPYQQVPFQFSCHIVEAPGDKAKACGHIVKHANDPRREFMEKARAILPETGSIVVYNGSFEKGRLAECADFLPEYQPWVRKLQARFVDLLEPFRKFHYYHPRQHGSASIKAVLPVLTQLSYEKLSIRDGASAAQRFMEVTFGKASSGERERVWADLKKYCGLDTLAMLELVRALEGIVAVKPRATRPRHGRKAKP